MSCQRTSKLSDQIKWNKNNDKAFQKYFDQKVPRNIFKALVEKIQQKRIYKYTAIVKMPWKQFLKQMHKKKFSFFQISDYFSDKQLNIWFFS